MNEIENRVVDLIEKHLNGELSDAEKQELASWENQSESNRRIVQHLTDNGHLKHSISDSYPDERKDRVLASIHSMIEADKGGVAKVRMMRIRKLMSAAAAIVVIATAAYFLLNHKTAQQIAKTEEKKTPVTNDVRPGAYKARLTLADGSTIVLDSAAVGKLAKQGNTDVINQEGKLVYQHENTITKEVLYNTLSTSRGEMYPVTLSDGSKVWLNSASSIHYPVAFTGNERRVEITGEAYFEVAPSIGSNGKRPFVVEVNGMEVEVLGTHFNINSYSEEEAIKTTLLEGKVRVHSATNNATAILKPAEQAVLRRGQSDKITVNKDVDVEAEVSWRFGYFNFNNTDLKTMMRQLQRWYDVDVVYQGEIPDVQFLGEIPRELSLSQVLNVLQKQNIHFKMVGKKIIVTPN